MGGDRCDGSHVRPPSLLIPGGLVLGPAAGASHRRDPRPVTGEANERLLDEVFGLGEVPGHEVGGPEEGVGGLGDEAVELPVRPPVRHFMVPPVDSAPIHMHRPERSRGSTVQIDTW